MAVIVDTGAGRESVPGSLNKNAWPLKPPRRDERGEDTSEGLWVAPKARGMRGAWIRYSLNCAGNHSGLVDHSNLSYAGLLIGLKA